MLILAVADHTYPVAHGSYSARILLYLQPMADEGASSFQTERTQRQRRGASFISILAVNQQALIIPSYFFRS